MPVSDSPRHFCLTATCQPIHTIYLLHTLCDSFPSTQPVLLSLFLSRHPYVWSPRFPTVTRRPAIAFCIVSDVVLPISLALLSSLCPRSFDQSVYSVAFPYSDDACTVCCKLASCRPSGPLRCNRFEIVLTIDVTLLP